MRVEPNIEPPAGSSSQPGGGDSRGVDRRRTFHVFAGPIVFLLMLIVPVESMTYEVRCSLGLLVWMSWWWITRPVHLAVTGFLPLAVVSVFDFAPIARILPAYATELIILLLSVNILTTAWTRWGLDRRIALAEALILQEEELFVDARLRLTEHLPQTSDTLVARFVRARLLFHEGRDREAIEEFMTLGRIAGPRPRWLQGWTELYLGMALSREGDEKQARSHFRRASQIKRFESADRGFLELLKLEGVTDGCGV